MENMKSASRNIVVNPTFQEWMYEDEKHFTDAPIKRQITYREEIGLNPSEDPWKQRHDYGTKSARHGSSRALLVLVCILCVLSIAAIALNLLMFFGKLSYKCVCSADQLESVSAGALRSDADILDRVKKLESNLTAIQEKLLTKANELQHLQVVLSSELSNTAEKLDRVNISILRLIGNVSSEIQDKLNLTEIELQKSDSNLATSLDEVRKNLTAKINDTIAHVLDTETKLETSIESTNKTLNHKLNWTTQLLEAKDESILDTVGNINSSLHAKADAGFAELRITSADTKETISKINTTLLGRIVSEIEELNVDLNSTTSDLKASSIERDEILKTVNTTLVMKISGLKIDTDQLSSSLSASQVNLEKLNLTLTNATAKIDSVDVLISQLSSSLATSQSNLAKVNETVLSNTQGLNSAKQTLMQEDINIRDLISAVNTTLSIKVENISKSQGPIGPRGFNGSLGATGERGPQGFNGTQGPHGDLGLPGFNGSQGPRGFIGPQGPQGAGNFSQCQHVSDSITGTQSPIASNSDASTQVSIREPSDKRIVGASCSTDIAQQYVLSVTPDPSGSLYACDCKGHYGLGAQTITCIIHYWQCPLKT